jgi:hypothetical protein
MDSTPPHAAPPGPRHWLDEPRNVKRLWRGFLVVLAITVLAEFAVHLHPYFEVESVFGFYAWFGLLACVAMIVFAKALALLLKRPDTYYDGRDDD